MDIHFAFVGMRQDIVRRAGMMERVLTSDFAAARAHLDRAYQYLQGTDEISSNARAGLDILIEAVITAQHARRPAKIIRFPVRNGGRNEKRSSGEL